MNNFAPSGRFVPEMCECCLSHLAPHRRIHSPSPSRPRRRFPHTHISSPSSSPSWSFGSNRCIPTVILNRNQCCAPLHYLSLRTRDTVACYISPPFLPFHLPFLWTPRTPSLPSHQSSLLHLLEHLVDTPFTFLCSFPHPCWLPFRSTVLKTPSEPIAAPHRCADIDAPPCSRARSATTGVSRMSAKTRARQRSNRRRK